MSYSDGGNADWNEDVNQDVNQERSALKTIGWLSVGVGAVALGVYIGREILCRYQFKRRTPYDFYSHSGDKPQGVEYGMGI